MIGNDYAETGTGEVAVVCPFCDTEKKKMYVSPRGQFICFVCETKGNSVYSFAMQYYQCSFKEAKAMLHENYRLNQANHHEIKTSLFAELTKLSMEQEAEQQSLKPVTFPTNIKLLEHNLNNPEAYPYLWYLKRRKISLQQIKQYHIGYVKSGKLNRDNGQALPIEQSIIFFTYDQDKPVYWSTRSIEYRPFIKSLNAISGDNTYSRRGLFWNMDKINHNSNMIICEGIFNALMACQGLYTGIATLGKAITNDQIDLMCKLNPKRFYIFLDNDAKQQELELAKRLRQKGIDYSRIYLVTNPYGNKDANDLGVDITRKLLDNAKPCSLTSLMKLR